MNQGTKNIIEKINKNIHLIKSFGVKNIWLFGSVVKNETSSNDIDILVEFESSPKFRQYMNLKFELETLLNKPIDLLSLGSCKKSFLNHIKDDLTHVA